MPSLPRRRRNNPWLQRVLLVATVVVLVDAMFGDRGVAESRKARRAYASSYTGLVELRHTNAGLRAQARRLSEDLSAIEGIAREELGLMRADEVMFLVKSAR